MSRRRASSFESAEEFEAGWLEYNPLHARFWPHLKPRLALGLAGSGRFFGGRAECCCRGRFISVVSRSSRHAYSASPGERYEHGRHLARPVDVCCRISRRCAQEPACCNADGACRPAGRHRRGDRPAQYSTGDISASGSLAVARRSIDLRRQWTGLSLAWSG